MHYEQLYGAVGDSIHCNTGLWFKIDVPHETRRGPESEGRLVSMFTNRGGFPFEIPLQCIGSLGHRCTNPYSVFAFIYLFIYFGWCLHECRETKTSDCKYRNVHDNLCAQRRPHAHGPSSEI